MIKAAILDFDGVILESVEVKGKVFEEVFDDYPDAKKEILAYHYANGGVSRFEKFRYIYEHILKQPLSDQLFQQLCQRFENLVVARVLAVDFVPGAKKFIEQYHQRINLYIVSATPDEEIKHIVKARGIDVFFKGVHGSPETKSAWTLQILLKGKYQPHEVIWVGDALSDWQAAMDHGIKFFARIVPARDVFGDRKVEQKIESLDQVAAFIDQL